MADLTTSAEARVVRGSLVRLRAKRYGVTSTKLEERRRGEGGRTALLIVDFQTVLRAARGRPYVDVGVFVRLKKLQMVSGTERRLTNVA